MARKRTTKTLSDSEIEELAAQLVPLHKWLVKRMSSIRADQEHYRAIDSLNSALCDTLRRVSGKDDLPWVVRGPRAN